MATVVYPADGSVEDSVRECNGAGVLFVLGIIVCVFLSGLIFAFIKFSEHIHMFKPEALIAGASSAFVVCVLAIIHFALEKNAIFKYTFNNGRLEIFKIRKIGEKKLMFSADCDSMEVMGPSTGKFHCSEAYKKTKANKYTDIHVTGEGLDADKRVYCEAFFNTEGKYIMIYFNPSERFIKAMRNQYPSKVLYDDSDK